MLIANVVAAHWHLPNDALLATILTLWGMYLLRRGTVVLRRTTMLAPWAWGVASIIAIGGSEVFLASVDDPAYPWAAHLRFVAATLTFCPAMAQLGAKRPQNRAWQLIVLSLVAIVALPAIEAWMRDRPLFELHVVRSWFLLLLILVGVVNNLPTRFGRAALTFGVAQLALFWPHLPWGDAAIIQPTALLGLGLIDIALLLVVRSRPNEIATFDPQTSDRAATTASSDQLPHDVFAPLNRLWRDFRDWYGSVWGLRVIERVNASARQQGWNVTLDWEGFVRSPDAALTTADEPLPPISGELSLSIDRLFRGLLWRFVSDDWIDERLKNTGRITS